MLPILQLQYLMLFYFNQLLFKFMLIQYLCWLKWYLQFLLQISLMKYQQHFMLKYLRFMLFNYSCLLQKLFIKTLFIKYLLMQILYFFKIFQGPLLLLINYLFIMPYQLHLLYILYYLHIYITHLQQSILAQLVYLSLHLYKLF